MAIETTKWNVAEHLDSPEAIEAYLEAAFEDGDPRVITNALRNVARAKGMSLVAEEAGISRAGLYKALDNGDPRLTTLTGILRSLGFTMTVRSAGRCDS